MTTGARWWRRVLLPWLGPGRDDWPTGVPPTVPGTSAPQFHCHACRTPVAASARDCPSCGERLVD